jgi:hypothetical protein
MPKSAWRTSSTQRRKHGLQFGQLARLLDASTIFMTSNMPPSVEMV